MRQCPPQMGLLFSSKYGLAPRGICDLLPFQVSSHNPSQAAHEFGNRPSSLTPKPGNCKRGLPRPVLPPKLQHLVMMGDFSGAKVHPRW